MKLGYSMLLGEHIAADMISYGDCKRFQIICPNCHEPVFKVERPTSESTLRYLSHYEKDKAYNDVCELRVSQIKEHDIQRQNSTSRNQKLDYFLGVLRNTIFKNEYRPVTSELRRFFKQIKRSKGLAVLRDILFDFIRSSPLRNDSTTLSSFMDDYLRDNDSVARMFSESALSVVVQKHIATDVWAHLLSPKAKANFDFLVDHAFIFLMTRIEQARNIRPLESWEQVIYEKMNDLRNSARQNGIEVLADLKAADLHIKLMSEVTHEMLGCLIRLPYLEILANRPKPVASMT